MKKETFIFVFLPLMLFVILESVSAELIISGLEGVYNIGDNVNVNVSIQKQKNTADYLETYLDCGDRLLVHKKYYPIEENKKKDVTIEFPASLKGNCSIEAIFDGESKDSQEFEISEVIELDYTLNNKIFFPAEKLSINGSAKKKNGEKLKGFVRISFGTENKTIDVNNGNFSFEFEIKKDVAPGKYTLAVEAFEKNAQEEIINYGKKTEEIEIKGKPTSIKIDGPESVKPPLDFSAKISLLDQAGGFIDNESIIVKLADAENMVYEGEVKSGRNFSYYFLDNSSRGFWRIRTYYGSIFSEKPILIEDNKKIIVDIFNNETGSYLIIKNIGNMEYNGTVLFSASSDLGEQSLHIPVGLEMGGEMQQPLNLSGKYNVSAGGRNFTDVELFPARITGAAILPEIRISPMSYLYFFIILIILIAIYFLIKKVRKIRNAGKRGEKWKEKEGKAEPEPQEGENIAFMLFFRFDKYVEEVKEIVEKENLSLTKLSDNLYYVLFYSDSNRNPEIFSYSLARKIRNKTMAKGHMVSIAINSGTFKNKEKFLKEFSLLTRKIVDHAQGGILVSEDIYKKNKIRAEKSLLFKENGEVYRMYKV